MPRLLAANSGKVINQRDANPCKEGNAQGKTMSQKVKGSNPGVSKIFFLS